MHFPAAAFANLYSSLRMQFTECPQVSDSRLLITFKAKYFFNRLTFKVLENGFQLKINS